MEVELDDFVPNEKIKFAVIVARQDGKGIFCKHKEHSTYEIPGRRYEAGENVLSTAKRELYEETGAREYAIERVCVYSVTGNNCENDTGEELFGLQVEFETEM